MVFIDIVGPDGSRTVAVPTADVTIGSGADNDIQLVHPDVASRHTLVIERGGHAIVLDTSGRVTMVNNHAIREATILSTYCQVGIGPFRIRFRHVDLPPDTVQTITQPLNERPAPPPATTKRTGEIQVPIYTSEPRIASSAPTPRTLSETAFEAFLNSPESRGPQTEPSIVRGLLVASNDPIELEFIRSILEDDDPQDARLVYADWLEQRGDETRAHYMRLVNELASHVNASYIQQERLREAGTNLGVPWRATVAPRWLPIERCPLRNTDEESVLRPCPQTWGRIGRGSVDDLRRCESCTRYVKYVANIDEGKKAAAQGTPVVVDGSVGRAPSDLEPPRPSHAFRVLGRRPCSSIDSGSEPDSGSESVGAFFASAAALEALSVTAFEWLALDLAELGAPMDLQARALLAACEETRHARAMSDLALAFGGPPPRYGSGSAATRPKRDAVAIAIENAIEGCVRESYGAKVAEWQAEHAEAADVRTALTTIAREEASHASLAGDIAAWLEARLSCAEREHVAMARERAHRDLVTEVASSQEPPPDVLRITGHPTTKQALTLAASSL